MCLVYVGTIPRETGKHCIDRNGDSNQEKLDYLHTRCLKQDETVVARALTVPTLNVFKLTNACQWL